MTLSIRADSVAADLRSNQSGETKHDGITGLFLGCQVNPEWKFRSREKL